MAEKVKTVDSSTDSSILNQSQVVQPKVVRSYVFAFLGIAVVWGLALGLNNMIVARKQADLLAVAKADLEVFTHGLRQTSLSNGRQVPLEVPLFPVEAVRGLASESADSKPSQHAIPEKLKQQGPTAQSIE